MLENVEPIYFMVKLCMLTTFFQAEFVSYKKSETGIPSTVWQEISNISEFG